jgi:hypothetical protein
MILFLPASVIAFEPQLAGMGENGRAIALECCGGVRQF